MQDRVVRFTLRMRDSLHRQVSRMAGNQDRSLNNMITHIVKVAVGQPTTGEDDKGLDNGD